MYEPTFELLDEGKNEIKRETRSIVINIVVIVITITVIRSYFSNKLTPLPPLCLLLELPIVMGPTLANSMKASNVQSFDCNRK